MSKTFIDAVCYDTVAEVIMLFVDEKERGKGVGTKTYEDFEKSLPKNIQRVKLFAADTGSGNSNDFWEKLGFDYVYTSDCADELKSAVGYEGFYTMHKGVNGFKTPEAIFVEPEVEED